MATYKSAYSGPQIDEAIGRVLSGTTNGSSNRNLLDNGWFTINQRGSASYTSAGYTVDRWKLNVWNTTAQSVTVNTNGITLSGTASGANNCMFVQKIENYAALAGKTVTVTVLTGNVTGSIKVFYSTNGESSWSRAIAGLSANSYNTGTITIPSGASGLSIAIGKYASDAGSGNTDIDILAVKLELGSVSTLANDVAPNYAEELLKCQRYFLRIKGYYTAYQTASSAVPYQLFVQFPVVMRAVPTISNVVYVGTAQASGITADYSSMVRFYSTSGGFTLDSFNASADL